MKRKAPTRQDQTPKEPDAQKRSFFSQDRTSAFFPSSTTDAFFQPPAKQAAQKSSAGATGTSSATPAPYYISFTHVAPPARPDHSQSNPGPSNNAANRAGFTRIGHRPSLSIAWGRTLMPNAQGQVGIYVRSANVGFNVHTLTVAISSDYARGSCPYHVTYVHEYRHARNFLNIFRSHRPTMVQKAQDTPLPTAQTPHYVAPSQVGAAQEQIAAPLVQAVRDVKGQITADMRADRDSMDSPSSYAREYAQCSRSAW